MQMAPDVRPLTFIPNELTQRTQGLQVHGPSIKFGSYCFHDVAHHMRPTPDSQSTWKRSGIALDPRPAAKLVQRSVTSRPDHEGFQNIRTLHQMDFDPEVCGQTSYVPTKPPEIIKLWASYEPNCPNQSHGFGQRIRVAVRQSTAW